MQFIKTKLFNGEVNVLFTGENYFFFHGFHGLICVAQRVIDDEWMNNTPENYREKFILYAGHRDYDYEKECFALAKRIIGKYEQQHIRKTIRYDERITDLSKCLVSVSYDLNHFH